MCENIDEQMDQKGNLKGYLEMIVKGILRDFPYEVNVEIKANKIFGHHDFEPIIIKVEVS